MEGLAILTVIFISFVIGLFSGALFMHLINWNNEQKLLNELESKTKQLNEKKKTK